ncbi:MAG: stage V sporulation protein AE [Clostridia bacterium]|nr:stage V sporulation protein AE [Clostridia bacterium]
MSLLWDMVKAFLVGGAICAVVQIFIDKTALTPARILVCLVTLGVVLGAIGVYKPFIDFAGCGASVPLTGFGATLAEGVRKAVDERGLIGALTGGLAGSAGGIAAAIFFGYFFALVFRSKPRD